MKMTLRVIFLTMMMTSAVLCYDEKYDKINVDKILADDVLFTSYLDCFLSNAPCDPEYSSDFKELLPEVIQTACGKCNDLQKKNVRKMVSAIYERKPDKALEFHKKFDPNGEYEPNFAAFLVAGN